ncbi:PREDICTED: uncharacterized protein LOC106148338 [Chinchilla lanigera]|uniref:uncharacterized protein LOC106148338 n=1 Tax=Chinchilla lanigera TaxID=34839 RepID=UPI000695AF24|nr:PREDICTED: uncharacterized protein LOC106148338 [Chinchilla lanigera]
MRHSAGTWEWLRPGTHDVCTHDGIRTPVPGCTLPSHRTGGPLCRLLGWTEKFGNCPISSCFCTEKKAPTPPVRTSGAHLRQHSLQGAMNNLKPQPATCRLLRAPRAGGSRGSSGTPSSAPALAKPGLREASSLPACTLWQGSLAAQPPGSAAWQRGTWTQALLGDSAFPGAAVGMLMFAGLSRARCRAQRCTARRTVKDRAPLRGGAESGGGKEGRT